MFFRKSPKVTIRFTPEALQTFYSFRPKWMRWLSSYLLEKDLRDYIAAHEVAGIEFKAEGHELIYDDDLTLRIVQGNDGIWYIADLVFERPSRKIKGYTPVFTFRRIKEGGSYVVRRFLSRWLPIREPSYIGLRSCGPRPL